MIIVITDEKEGDRIAGRVAAMDPYGISMAEVEGQAVVALVGGDGAELLWTSRHPTRPCAASGPG